MSRRRHYAAVGDRKNWSQSRLIEFERSRRSFEAAAKQASQDPHRPDAPWLFEYFRDLRKANRSGFMRRRARDIVFYLADSGMASLMDDSHIQTLLHCPDDEDPLSFDLAGSGAAIRRARALGDAAFASGTMQGYALHCKRYVSHCQELGIDHLNPPPELVLNWLAFLGVGKAWQTVNNARNALSHLFRKNDVPDFARSAQVTELLDGLRNVKPQQPTIPFTREDRYRMLTSLETEGFGIRDRVAILLSAFSPWGVERLALIDIGHISFSGDGVQLEAGASKKPIVVGRNSDPELDLEPWLRKLIDMVGNTGPLFQPFDQRRLRFSGTPLSPQALSEDIRNAAKRAAVDHVNVTTRLRLLFELECRDAVPDIVFRHYDFTTKRTGARDPDERSDRLKIRRKRGFSTITP